MATDIPAEFRAKWDVPAFDVRLDRPRAMEACVVIPVINEGERIHALLRRMAALRIPAIADILIVDGGSTDGSLEPKFLASHEVRALLVKTGPGRLSAQLRCAYAYALDENYREIVTIDGNDKDDPEAIPTFVDAIRRGFDFVQASRFIPGGFGGNTPGMRSLAIRAVHAPLLSLCSGFRWTDTTQGFRAYSRRMLLDQKLDIFRAVFSDYELLAYLSYRAPRLGYRCLELPTRRIYPAGGPIPTKISNVKGNLALMLTLIRACSGAYDA